MCVCMSVQAGELSHMKEYQRYMRLQHLLQKSSIYSKFLLDQMENQVQEKKVLCVCVCVCGVSGVSLP